MITSRANDWYRRVRDAIREHEEEIVIEGPKAVRDAAAAGWRPIAVVREETGEAGEIVFSRALFRSVSDTKTSQGVLALFERPRIEPARFFARRDSIFIALDGVQDPGNAGTIVRLAAAFDAAGVVVLPGSADPLSPKSIRASAGAVLSVPILETGVDSLLASGLDLYAAAGEGSEHQPPARAAVLVFGAEGTGVSAAIRAHAREISVVTSGRVESLNVAAAAAILLWRSFCSRSGIDG